MSYLLGAQVRLGFTVADEDGALVDSVTQTVTVTLPSGSTSTPTVDHDGTGEYSAQYTTTAEGLHTWRATTTVPSVVVTGAFYVSALPVAQLVSLADARAFLNNNDTADTDELVAFIEVASVKCQETTSRAWTPTTVVDSRCGGSPTLFLSREPIVSVTSVVEDGSTLDASAYTARAHGMLRRAFGVWGDDVTVTYVSGDGVIPATVRQGILLLLQHLWTTQRGGSSRVGSDETWDPSAAYTLPRRVEELWASVPTVGIG